MTHITPDAEVPALPPAVAGERHVIDSAAGRLCFYSDAPPGPGSGAPPLLLVHSVNAAATAYEVRPLYEHYRHLRPVYALELPGFGGSERSKRAYTPRLMTDAVLALIDVVRERHGAAPFDALALSLSCEFLARAALERAGALRSLALLSPTGFNGREPRRGPPGGDMGSGFAYRLFTFPVWTRSVYRGLTSRASIRFFLRKTWGSKNIDGGLAEYDWLTARQPGARHAPFCFVSGKLFSTDAFSLYESLESPVLMVHGTRGDFVDYRHEQLLRDRANWRFEVLETGALPHFEQPERIYQMLDDFHADASDEKRQRRA